MSVYVYFVVDDGYGYHQLMPVLTTTVTKYCIQACENWEKFSHFQIVDRARLFQGVVEE